MDRLKIGKKDVRERSQVDESSGWYLHNKHRKDNSSVICLSNCKLPDNGYNLVTRFRAKARVEHVVKSPDSMRIYVLPTRRQL